MYGETFYGRHTAQHQLQWSQIKSEMRSFKSSENIHKKEGGSKPVLQAPNLALSFYHGSKHTVVRSAWRFSNSSMDHHVKQINHR